MAIGVHDEAATPACIGPFIRCVPAQIRSEPASLITQTDDETLFLRRIAVMDFVMHTKGSWQRQHS